MKISLSRLDQDTHFELKNESGHTIQLSGNDKATGPMESVLMAVAGCSTIDIVMIMDKMRQPLKDISVEVEGIRREEIPRVFTEIRLHYIVHGPVKESKVQQAIASSLDKYCSVSKMLEASVKITSSFELRN